MARKGRYNMNEIKLILESLKLSQDNIQNIMTMLKIQSDMIEDLNRRLEILEACNESKIQHWKLSENN